MKRFKTLICYLANGETDADALAWTTNIARLAESTSVTILHAWRPEEFPESLKKKYPELFESTDKTHRSKIEALVTKHLRLGPEVKLEIIVKPGSPDVETLELAERKSADLVICGRGPIDSILVQKLARKCSCSIMAVPSGSSTEFQSVLAAVDYSEESKNAMEVAAAFAKAGAGNMTVFHAFPVPWGQQRTTIPREVFEADLRAFHREKLRTLTEASDLQGIKPIIRLEESVIPPFAITNSLHKAHHDLVTIGCRGRNAVYTTLLGSTAEAILQTSPVPVIAVKEKGASRSLLEVLRSL